jgi:hypothetical protein
MLPDDDLLKAATCTCGRVCTTKMHVAFEGYSSWFFASLLLHSRMNHLKNGVFSSSCRSVGEPAGIVRSV